MTMPRERDLALAREAAAWLDRLDTDEGAASVGFVKWITASPLHVDAFLNVTAVDSLLGGVDRGRRIDVATLIASLPRDVVPIHVESGESQASSATVRRADSDWSGSGSSSMPSLAGASSLPGPSSVSGRAVRWRLQWAAALVLAVGLIGFAGWKLTPMVSGSRTYATDRGELRSVELPDGSSVRLNARSRVTVRFTGDARDVYLDGEAMFSVKHESQRPFRVHSGNSLVQAIGTQFNVDRRPSGTVVVVLEGAVQVSASSTEDAAVTASGADPAAAASTLPLRLSAGEGVRVHRDGRIERRDVPAPGAEDARWPDRRLLFSDDRLDDIAAEFNRWNATQIAISGDALGAKLFSGTFDAHDPESLIAFLSRDPDVVVERKDDSVVVRSR